jgi:hypothetical protein
MIINRQPIRQSSPSPVSLHSILSFHRANLHLSQLDGNVRNVTADPPRTQGHAVTVHDSLGLGPPLLPQELLLAHAFAWTAWQAVVTPRGAVALLVAGRSRERKSTAAALTARWRRWSERSGAGGGWLKSRVEMTVLGWVGVWDVGLP